MHYGNGIYKDNWILGNISYKYVKTKQYKQISAKQVYKLILLFNFACL